MGRVRYSIREAASSIVMDAVVEGGVESELGYRQGAERTAIDPWSFLDMIVAQRVIYMVREVKHYMPET